MGQYFENGSKIWKWGKKLETCQNFENGSKFWKWVKIWKKGQYFENGSKIWKCVKKFENGSKFWKWVKILKMGQNFENGAKFSKRGKKKLRCASYAREMRVKCTWILCRNPHVIYKWRVRVKCASYVYAYAWFTWGRFLTNFFPLVLMQVVNFWAPVNEDYYYSQLNSSFSCSRRLFSDNSWQTQAPSELLMHIFFHTAAISSWA